MEVYEILLCMITGAIIFMWGYLMGRREVR